MGWYRELIEEKEAMDPGLKTRDSWKQCASLLLKLDEKRKALFSDHVLLDDPEKDLPIVSSLYTGFREVGHDGWAISRGPLTKRNPL